MKLKPAINSVMHRKIPPLPNNYWKNWNWFVIDDKCSVSCVTLQISAFTFPLA